MSFAISSFSHFFQVCSLKLSDNIMWKTLFFCLLSIWTTWSIGRNRMATAHQAHLRKISWIAWELSRKIMQFFLLLKRIAHFSTSEVNQSLFSIELKDLNLRVITWASVNSGLIWYVLDGFLRETKKCPCLAKNWLICYWRKWEFSSLMLFTSLFNIMIF